MSAPILLRVARLAPVLRDATTGGTDWLGADEAARLAAMASVHRQQQFLAGHWLVRALASRHGGGTIADWRWSRAEAQPAIVQRDGQQLFSSISHSGDWLACAVGDAPIGLDIEAAAKPRDYLAMAAHAFSPEECARLADSPDDLAADFHRYWTIKEATGKRGGQGLRVQASRRQVPVLVPAGSAFDVETWQADGLVLALAHSGVARVAADGLPADARHSQWWVRVLD